MKKAVKALEFTDTDSKVDALSWVPSLCTVAYCKKATEKKPSTCLAFASENIFIADISFAIRFGFSSLWRGIGKFPSTLKIANRTCREAL